MFASFCSVLIARCIGKANTVTLLVPANQYTWAGGQTANRRSRDAQTRLQQHRPRGLVSGKGSGAPGCCKSWSKTQV